MSVLVLITTLTGSFLVTPFLIFILCIIFLASLGKSLGVRRLYVSILVKIFEYGRVNIEKSKRRNSNELEKKNLENGTTANANNDKNNGLTQEDDDDDDEDNTELPQTTHEPNNKVQNGNGFMGNGNTVITRDVKLLPPDSANDSKKDSGKTTDDEKDDDKILNFQLSNCFDYIKAGMEAIIEDEVTSRFEAEELKNWNLLTRTNRQYEFISWRLTVIWVFGFFMRYIILMPLRVLICFIAMAWTVFSFAVIGLVPNRGFRLWLNDRAFKISFRLISRSISALINFHNTEYRPKNCGFCVANHTSPIDIAILSTDCSYSLVLWLTICTALAGCLPENKLKRAVVHAVLIHCLNILACAISSVVTYHNLENRPKNGICVANHTSPIDSLMLMCDGFYSLIGQRHGGFLGILQRALIRASPHIWFERAESKDRNAVARRLREHVSNPDNPPILIFPEGTCINNTSVMQFKKGSFEVGGVIYPVAIKYDARFGDAFWNSSKYSMMQYLYMMMTSWAIVCDVWYLPPMHKKEDESAIDFANRVKSVIAKQGGLVDLQWDGGLKRAKPKKEWKERQQEEFTKRLKGE